MANIVTHLGQNLNWTAYKLGQNSFTITFTSSGSAFDISTYTFVVNITKMGDTTNVLQLTEGSGITNGGAAGTLVIALTQTQANTTLPGSDYWYEIAYTKDAKVYALLQGTLQLSNKKNLDSTNTSATVSVNLSGSAVSAAVTLAGASLTSATIATALGAQTATHFLGGPTPSFRAIAAADLPDLSGTYQTALGFTPENTTYKATTFATVNDTLFPTVEAVHENTRRSGFYNVTTIAALQTYLSGLGAGVDVNIFFPSGSYSVTSAITIASKGKVKIFSEGAIITNARTTSGDVFDIDSCTEVWFKDIRIDMNLNANTTDGIDILNVTGGLRFDSVDIYNLGNQNTIGIRMQNAPSSAISYPGTIFNNCNFYNVPTTVASFDYNSNNAKGIGVYLYEVAEYFKFTNCTFLGLQIAIHARNGANGAITACNFIWCNPILTGPLYRGVVYIEDNVSNQRKISFIGNKFNHNWGYCIRTDSNGSSPFIISSNYFITNAVTPIVFAPSGTNIINGNWFANSANALTASNNPFAAGSYSYISLVNSNDNHIFGNGFSNQTNSEVAIKESGTSTGSIIRDNFFGSGLTPYTIVGATSIVELPTVSSTLNFGSTAAQSSTDLTVTVTGAADGDVVTLGVPASAVNANTCYTAWVSAADTVTVRFNNYSSGAVDPASAAFRIAVTKH